VRRIWRILVTLLALLGLLTIGLGVAAGILASRLADHHHRPSLPDKIVLDFDLDRGLDDQPPGDGLARFARPERPALRDLVESLERGGTDSRVLGVGVRLGRAHLALAHVQELRDALAQFRAKGKFAMAFAESLGEFGNATGETYLAAAFDEIWLQPSGDVGLTGFQIEMPFFKGTLDKLDITARVGRRHEYKSAPENFTETAMSREMRESLSGLLTSWFEQTVAGIAKGRRLAPERMTALVDEAPFDAEAARAAGLVDRLGYRDEFDDALKDRAKEAERVEAEEYLDQAGRPHAKGRKIAFIHASGPVVSGSREDGPFGDGKSIAADDIVGALEDAVDDKAVAAILLRIDSPGGSYLASDTVWRAVLRARTQGKPVVASVGTMAASGGYFIAMAAERIIAQPASIVGSIGVFAGKPVLDKFWARFGVTWDETHIGANADLWSPNRDFSPTAKRKFDATLDRIYADFTAKAGKARHLEGAALDRAARGRVFTGSQGVAVGLVDELGGLETALAALRQAAKIGSEEPVQLVPFPKPKSLIEKLMAAAGRGGLPFGLEGAARVLALAKPLADHLEALAPGRPASLRLPPLEAR